MVDLGLDLVSETHGPDELVECAARAEDAGFDLAVVAKHFHPWPPKLVESPFVWRTAGAIAQLTEGFEIGTSMTSPLNRINLAIINQNSATGQAMRLELLEGACGVMPELWSGEAILPEFE